VIALFALGPPVMGLFDTTCHAIQGEIGSSASDCS
jgi:hypothetical protein